MAEIEVVILHNVSSKDCQTPGIGLLKAVRENDDDVINTWIKIITDGKEPAYEHLHDHDESGNTVLHYLVERNNLQAINSILQTTGLDVSVKNNRKETVLHVACREGHAEILKIILNNSEISLNDEDKDGHSPLHLAVINQHTEVAKFLLQLEDNEGHKNYCSFKTGLSALHHAVYSSSLDMIDLLLKNGANVNLKATKQEYGMTPLMIAVNEENIKIVKLLLRNKASLAVLDYKERNIFHWMAMKKNNDITMLQLLLNETADTSLLHHKDVDQFTPLWTAIVYSNVAMMKKLISMDFSHELEEYESLVLFSAARGQLEILKELLTLRKGVSVNCRDNNGYTPLHLACSSLHLKMVQFLLSQGANCRAKNNEENTPLHLALHDSFRNLQTTTSVYSRKFRGDDNQTFNRPRVVELLVNAGADVTAQNKFEKTPIYYASCDKDCIMILLRNGAKLMDIPAINKWMITLIKTYPDDAVEFLDRCVEPAESNGSTLEEVVVEKRTSTFSLNVKLVDNFFNEQEGTLAKARKEKIHPLKLLVERKRYALLKHPVITALIKYKWNKYGLVVYLLNLLFYAIFLAFLTAFALTVKSPRQQACMSIYKDLANGTFVTETSNCTMSSSQRLTVLTCASFTIVFSIFRLLIELFQYIRLREAYFWDVINWLELILYFSALNFVWVFHSPCLCAQSGQWEAGVIAVFLGWILFTVNCDKLAFIGVYVTMFLTIFKTFLKTIVLSVLLIIAFGLSFFMLFGVDASSSPNPFGSIVQAFIKTMTMSTGELTYNEIFNQLPDDNLQPVVYPNTSFFLWVAFVILMAVLLTNLLTGLAVGDVKEIQDIAEIQRIQLKIQYLLAIDGFLTLHLKKYWSSRDNLEVIFHHHSRWQHFFDSIISRRVKRADLALHASHFMPVYERLKENSSGHTSSDDRLELDFGKTLVEIKQALVTHEKLLAQVIEKLETDNVKTYF